MHIYIFKHKFVNDNKWLVYFQKHNENIIQTKHI